jgi:hypothetical protein
MFVIDLRRADGSVLPFQLSVEPEDAHRVKIRVLNGESSIAEAAIPYGRVPLGPDDLDVKTRQLSLGFEPCFGWLLVEFGHDARLGMVLAAEVRAALGVCRCYGHAMVSQE